VARKPSGKKTAGKKTAGMAAKRSKKRTSARGESEGTLLTLTDVSKRTGISMPTLQKYKRNHQARIPAVGRGRKQRYPESALAVFEQIKEENLKKRGRPAKGPARSPRKKKASASGLISLAEVSRRTKISYPTLLRYQKLHGERIPSQGKGRKRRYPEQAVQVFETIRSGSRRGRRPAAKAGRAPRTAAVSDRALAKRIERIESMQAELSRQLDAVVELLRKPLQVTIRPE
jgi:predicted site-specific integrase-resolvase